MDDRISLNVAKDDRDETHEIDEVDEVDFSDDSDETYEIDAINETGDIDDQLGNSEEQVYTLEYESSTKQANVVNKKIYTTPSFIYPREKESGEATYRFFGNLFLQDPLFHLSPERLDEYLQLQPAIHDLETRTRSPRSSLAFDYNEEFKAFQEAETKLWSDRGIHRPKEELIPVSGNIATCSLAHRLHNPSFTTLNIDNGVTADTSNPCTALVMANGFDDTTIMLDHVVRRDTKDPFIYYPEDILACHEQHVSLVRDHMNAPVEVVYGVPTWKRTMLYLQGRLEPFDLWGSYEGITLFLEWDSIDTVDSVRKLKRFLIAAFHPQNLLLPWSKKYTSIQDKLLEVAYNLAGVQFVPQFFASSPWQRQINVPPHSHYARTKPQEHKAKLSLIALHDSLRVSTDPAVRKQSTRLYNLLTADVERLMKSRGNQASPNDPFALPALSPSASMTIIWPKRHEYAWSHLLKVSGSEDDLPTEVPCLCITCWGATIVGPDRCTIGIDPKPRWINTTPPIYVERRLHCKNCDIQRRFIPVDEKTLSLTEVDLNDFYDTVRGLSVKFQLESLQHQRPASRIHRWQKPAAKMTSSPSETTSETSDTMSKKAGIPGLIQSKHLELRPEQGPVATECTLCHKKGPVNYNPQWIIGSSLYLARRTTKCMSKSCLNQVRQLIPMDKKIKYMTHTTFNHHSKDGTLDEMIQGRKSWPKHRQNRIPKGKGK